jgi:hypothetical protein
MAGFDRIGALTKELGRIAKDLERGFARYGQVLNELQGIGLPTQLVVAKRGPGRPRREAIMPLAAPRRRGRRGTLSKEIEELLTQSKRKMKPREIVETLQAKPPSVSTTLNRLAKLGRVKHNAQGWYV